MAVAPAELHGRAAEEQGRERGRGGKALERRLLRHVVGRLGDGRPVRERLDDGARERRVDVVEHAAVLRELGVSNGKDLHRRPPMAWNGSLSAG